MIEFYLFMNKNEIIFFIRWVKFEIIMLSEIIQIERDIRMDWSISIVVRRVFFKIYYLICKSGLYVCLCSIYIFSVYGGYSDFYWRLLLDRWL